jgi:hypothetical protein
VSAVAGRPRKSESQRRGHRRYDTVKLVRDAGPVTVPALPDSRAMLQQTRDAWSEFWKSPVTATVVPESDAPALVRMFHLADELERCRRVFREKRLVEGSSGQPVINPVGSYMLALAKEVRALEDRFGANAMARLRLSVELGDAHRSLDAINSRMMQDCDVVDVVRVDPRFGVSAD